MKKIIFALWSFLVLLGVFIGTSATERVPAPAPGRDVESIRIEAPSEAPLPGAATPEAVPASEQPIVAALLENLRELEDGTGDLSQEAEREELLQTLARDSETLALLRSTITDLDSAERVFAGRQAAARLFGIQILKIAALQGDAEPLETAIRGTMRELNAGPWRKSRDADLTDLLEGWIQATGPALIAREPERLFAKFPYATSLRGPFATALRYVYKEKTEEPAFTARFLPFLKGELR